MLRDELFVYVSCAGVTMAGLLIIASLAVARALLGDRPARPRCSSCLGLIGIHLERAFPDAGRAVRPQALRPGVLLVGPRCSWRPGCCCCSARSSTATGCAGPFDGCSPRTAWQFVRPRSSIAREHLWLAIVLVAAGTYAYVYSDLVVRHIGVYVHVAAFTLMWLLVLVIEQLDLKLGIDALIGVLAGDGAGHQPAAGVDLRDSRYTRAFPVLGVLLPLAAVLIGVVVYFRHVIPRPARASGRRETPSWGYLGGDGADGRLVPRRGVGLPRAACRRCRPCTTSPRRRRR